MNRKSLGIIIFIFGFIFLFLTIIIHSHQNYLHDQLLIESGHDTCFLDDGTCLHQDNFEWAFTTLYILQIIQILIGTYLFFEKQLPSTPTNKKDEEFEQYLRGFTPEEKKVLKIVYSQEGIKQSTLRIKSGMSKATLSIVLQELERKGHIRKEKKGKTNQVFLQQF